ncbi:LGFP repeat-containing protein [Runella sp. SP2]|uniref:LGFP repeat-containing protein n=1 Tax=Runella sp. SP2 TaxID=2268026 RepID=UPI000F07B6DB|nr:hypothetical protein [Runella sp. SP2]AYQ30687.1 hypothetical protein DTQ70_00155 [Runella sp. SP2]
MKKITSFIVPLVCVSMLFLLTGCPKPSDPDYKAAIKAKYQQLGWMPEADNGGEPVKTASGNGWVQYYGNKDRAIYYIDGKAFGFLNYEMKKYEALGQDKFTALGTPTSDWQQFLTGITGNEFTKGVIVSTPKGVFAVYGSIYERYKAIGRWNSPLGYPIGDEGTMTTRKEGRFQHFTKTGPIGQIYWSQTTGAQAFWGKVEIMYGRAGVGYDGSWLGLPKSSCDPNKADNQQTVDFEKGKIITGPTCGAYLNQDNETVYQNGTRAANVNSIPCYNY